MRCSVIIPRAPARRILQQCGYGDPRAPAPGGRAGPGRWTDGRGRMPSPPAGPSLRTAPPAAAAAGGFGAAGGADAPET